ncbi:AAA family ATPase [Vibrio parahaemolyticus]|uniref:ATP-dependent nuclease n=1 Tax=Vibrio parahaemolyticus TaxID=670 RepID=UPI001D3280FA|nr:endonuclease [Vibrio parahaemolyticus]ELC9519673.1 AAA family ATPase [Vibrio alginolyticus]EHZ7316667.1 AAA family ATPase [Vibrio parahaemolyticus]EIA4665306.1 AAA family ATPase [Vibrio parahaemolyticus]EIC2725421.1 AAA family ATPase [Vibrio parahaemolyticus]
MKLTSLLIKNFKGIKGEIEIIIDNIVVLIGPNNACKSTVLDAYQAYCSMGSPLSIDFFHNKDQKIPIEITGVFVDLTHEDVEALGQEWLLEDDPEYGRCAKFQVRWDTPDEKGAKYSFSNVTHAFKRGGAGGWDTLLQSRLPHPIRINPNDGYEALEKIVKELASKSAEKLLKDDKGKLAGIIAEIQKLAHEVEQAIAGDIANINRRIEDEVLKLFSGLKVGFETGVGKFKPEDAIKDGSKFLVESNGHSTPLEHQGTGVQRAFLWSAINALCAEGKFKQGRKVVSNGSPKVLLLDEPEINLHPSVIKAARKAIYSLAELEGWQIICTTHSPVFIDLTQDHTTLIKVSCSQNGISYFQTDKANFSAEEKDNLKMLNRCCPTVNEFFFYDNSLLVEGDTENLAYQYIIERSGLEHSHCVINCRGKANIPTFIKIFNQFQSKAIALHDLDTKLNIAGGKNAMWTINERIREAADDTSGRVITVVHSPDFEGFYLGESPQKDKPYNLFKHLTSGDFEESDRYEELRESLNTIVAGTHSGLYHSVEDLEEKVAQE